MKALVVLMMSLACSTTAWADELNELWPQARRGKPDRDGFRMWLEVEGFSGKLEATDASGTGVDFDEKRDFNEDIDTWLQQVNGWLNGGWEFDFGLTLYAKWGYTLPTMIQDIDGSSPVVGADDERQGGAADRLYLYGIGADFRRDLGSKVYALGRVEWHGGVGDAELNALEFQDVRGNGEYRYSRLQARVAIGTELDPILAYVGVRYNWVQVEIDHEEFIGPDSFSVEYELDIPVGIVVGASNRIGDRIKWHAEIGLIDAWTVELGVGLAF